MVYEMKWLGLLKHYFWPLGWQHVVGSGIGAVIIDTFVPHTNFVVWVFGLVLLNTISGIVKAIYKGNFKWRKIGDSIVFKWGLYYLALSVAHSFQIALESPTLFYIEASCAVYLAVIEANSFYRNAKMVGFLDWMVKQLQGKFPGLKLQRDTDDETPPVPAGDINGDDIDPL